VWTAWSADVAEAQIRQAATAAQIGDLGLQPGLRVQLQAQSQAVLASPTRRIQGQGRGVIRLGLMAEVVVFCPLKGGQAIHLDHAEAPLG